MDGIKGKSWLGYLLLCSMVFFSGNPFGSPIPPHVRARLISEVESVQSGGSFAVGIWLEMEKGWHTYWKNPGDSGMPTRVEWDLPEGFEVSEIQWPCPKRFETAGLVSYGYEGEVVLMTEFKAPMTLRPGSEIKFLAKVEWLVCQEECIPGHEDLSLELPVRSRVPKKETRWAALFDRTRNDLPRFFDDWKIRAALDKEKIYIQVFAAASFNRQIRDIIFFPEQEGVVQYGQPQLLTEVQQGYMIELKRSKVPPAVPPYLRGILFSPQGWDSAGQAKSLRVDVPWAASEKILKEVAR